MVRMIARPEEPSPRLFPPISPDVYRSGDVPAHLTADQLAACALLTLAQRRGPWWQHLVWWTRPAARQLGRVLSYHRQALEAELQAHWFWADRYWRRAYVAFTKLAPRPALWESLAHTLTRFAPGTTVLHDPVRLRQRLVDEVFIDMHCALYNGRLRQVERPTRDDRAFAHVAYIDELLAWSGLSQSAQLPVLGPPTALFIALAKEAGKLRQAIKGCQTLLRRFPDVLSWRSQLLELQCLHLLAPFTTQGDEATLPRQIALVEQLRQRAPAELLPFELLGRLHHLHAIALANALRLAEALVAVQKALTYAPSLAQAQATWTHLCQVMAALRAADPSLARNDEARQEDAGRGRSLDHPAASEPDTDDDVVPNAFHVGMCPRCARVFVSSEQGRITCRHCAWEFEIDAHGDVVAGAPIEALYRTTQDSQLRTVLQTLGHRTPSETSHGEARLQACFAASEAAHVADTLYTGPVRQDVDVRALQALRSQRHIAQREAAQGFTLLQTYLTSPEAAQTARELQLARAQSLWQHIGLGVPADHWPERAQSLLACLQRVLDAPPASATALSTAWEAVAGQSAEAARLDSAPICAFLEQLLFRQERSLGRPQPFVPPVDPPILTGKPTARRGRVVSFVSWPVNRRAMLVKLQAVGIILFLVVGGLVGRDFYTSRVREKVYQQQREQAAQQREQAAQQRERAYQQMMEATATQDYLRLMKEAEAFLSHAPVNGQDSRRQRVIELYTEAFVRWFVSRGDPVDTEARTRIDMYRRLVPTTTSREPSP